MSETLYLIETRARRDYICPACQQIIRQGSMHFRHDPFPAARIHRGLKVTHWCRHCIMAANPDPKDWITRRIRIPVVRVVGRTLPTDQTELSSGNLTDLPLFKPILVELIGIGKILSERLASEPELIHRLSPDQMEELICDRLSAMGFEPRRSGAMNRADGGIDIFFWPRNAPFPFLGAAQVKHRRDANDNVGPSAVRDFAGAIAGRAINMGLLVTNTSFSPDAKWFAQEHAKLIRLRGFTDIRRWLLNNFSDGAEWRDIPSEIEVCPGVVVKIR